MIAGLDFDTWHLLSSQSPMMIPSEALPPALRHTYFPSFAFGADQLGVPVSVLLAADLTSPAVLDGNFEAKSCCIHRYGVVFAIVPTQRAVQHQLIYSIEDTCTHLPITYGYNKAVWQGETRVYPVCNTHLSFGEFLGDPNRHGIGALILTSRHRPHDAAYGKDITDTGISGRGRDIVPLAQSWTSHEFVNNSAEMQGKVDAYDILVKGISCQMPNGK